MQKVGLTIKHLVLLPALIFCFGNAMISDVAAEGKTDILFLLDGSGSMKEKIGGETKIESARKGLRTALGEISKDSFAGLRIYGNRVPQTNKTASCKDSTLEIPFGAVVPEKFEQTAAKVTPLGYTPISYSLEQARNDFPTDRESTKVIILLTDGEETCGGNPKATVEAMIKDGFAVKVYTIGFAVNDIAEKELRDVAAVSGGKYFSATNASELKDALSAATIESLLIDKKKTIDGTPIRGGDSFDTAVSLQLGVEYRLDHHQKPDFFDYFTFDGNVGDRITLTARTLEKGIEFKNNKALENEYPKSTVALLSPARGKLESATATGKFGRTSESLILDKAGKYFILVGGLAQNAENALFTVEKIILGDAGTDKDAGESYSSALPIAPGRYENNWFISDKDQDVYSFDGQKGESYLVAIIPEPGSDELINLSINSELGDVLVKKQSSYPHGDSANSGNFTLPDAGKYYISANGCCSSKPKKYAVVFKKSN
jgi:hypothetical protein